MTRRDIDPSERDKAPLVLTQLVDCAICKETFEVEFVAPDGVFDAEDIMGDLSTLVTCDGCGSTWMQAYEGWNTHDEA